MVAATREEAPVPQAAEGNCPRPGVRARARALPSGEGLGEGPSADTGNGVSRAPRRIGVDAPVMDEVVQPTLNTHEHPARLDSQVPRSIALPSLWDLGTATWLL